MDLTPATSYQRLLVHRCSAYYKLSPETDPVTKTIVVYYRAESRMYVMTSLLWIVACAYVRPALHDGFVNLYRPRKQHNLLYKSCVAQGDDNILSRDRRQVRTLIHPTSTHPRLVASAAAATPQVRPRGDSRPLRSARPRIMRRGRGSSWASKKRRKRRRRT